MRKPQKMLSCSNSHFSSQIYTHSTNQPQQSSVSRKISSSSLKKYVDVEKLIGDIKITPTKPNKIDLHVSNILRQLQYLKDTPSILDQIRAIELLIDSLSKKLACTAMELSRSINTNLAQRSGSKTYHQRLESTSPIKQFDDTHSQIVYAKFSIKEMNGRQLSELSSHRSVLDIQTPDKHSIYDDEEIFEMQKLNKQLVVLEKMLKSKGLEDKSGQCNILRKFDTNVKEETNNTSKKSNKYMQSENLCPPYRREINLNSNPHPSHSREPRNGIRLVQNIFRC